ncbi:hypothetical protein ACIPJ2_05985 [Curtobacterium sp. NPDC090217]|uniref:hypothetical protein n=1 Tax=Curtobacterium sp. NPDC090217 TaxID=3363970 RepID=UPI0037F4D4A9
MGPSTRPRSLIALATLAVAATVGLVVTTPASASAAATPPHDAGGTVLAGPFAYPPIDKKVSGTATSVTVTATPECQEAVRCEVTAAGVTPSSRELRPLAIGSQPWPSWVQPGEYMTVRFTSVAYGRNGGRVERWGGGDPWVGRPGPARTKLVAEIRSVDPVAKSAVIAGTATKGARVSIGGQGTVVDANTGTWSITVTGLSIGTNPLVAIQEINGIEYDRVPLSVVIDPPALDPVTVTGPATVQPGVENRFTGTATPRASFRVLDASGNPLTPGEHAVSGDGTWAFALTVPAGVTEFRFAIEQTANGRTETSRLFTIPADTRSAPAAR